MKRASGVLMHISSLWGNYSEGSFGAEAREWIDFLADCGFSCWQVLPFCQTDSYNSPYSSFSAFSGNPFFIDLPALHRDGLLTADELASARQQTPYACEFERLHRERFLLLSKAAARFTDEAALDRFRQEYPYTDDFCRFMTLKDANHGAHWTKWTVQVPDETTLRTWRFIEYTFFTQWAKIKKYANTRGISIIGDIPIYVAWDSADVWAHPDQFLLDENYAPSCVAGVPPDYFSAEGQLWGNPIYHWDNMKADNYRWWQDRMRFMTALFDGVRIDHFRGLESYWAIPAGETSAKNGKWVKGPGMDLIRALKTACGDKLLIAEDLGDITPEVYQLVQDSGFPGMRVLQFAFLGDRGSPHLPHNYDNNSIAYTGTHDNNTLLGYVWEMDEAQRRQLFDYMGYHGSHIDGCYDHIFRTMFASHAGLLILPVQDLLLYGSDTRFNTPGKSSGNWSFRITREQLKKIDAAKFRRLNWLYCR